MCLAVMTARQVRILEVVGEHDTLKKKQGSPHQRRQENKQEGEFLVSETPGFWNDSSRRRGRERGRGREGGGGEGKGGQGKRKKPVVTCSLRLPACGIVWLTCRTNLALLVGPLCEPLPDTAEVGTTHLIGVFLFSQVGNQDRLTCFLTPLYKGYF